MLVHLSYLSTALLGFSLLGLLISENVIAYLISSEILFLAISLKFLLYSILSGTIDGQLWAICILTIGGAETAILLAIFVLYSRVHRDKRFNTITNIKI